MRECNFWHGLAEKEERLSAPTGTRKRVKRVSVYGSRRAETGRIARREDRRVKEERGNRIGVRERSGEEALPRWRHPAGSGANSHHEPAMGKLATTRRRVTRDNEEQEASVYPRGPSGASSGRAFVAVPICGIALDSGAIPAIFASESLDPCAGERFCECRRSINGEISSSDSWKKKARGAGSDRQRSDKGRTRSIVETASGSGPLDGANVLGNAEVREDRRESSCEGKVAAKQWRQAFAWKNSSILLIAMAIGALCAAVSAVSAVPMPSRVDPLLRTGPRHDLDRSTGLEDVYEDAFEDAFQEEEQRQRTSAVLDETELEIIRRSIARGLGLKRIPDPSKVSPLRAFVSTSTILSRLGDREPKIKSSEPR